MNALSRSACAKIILFGEHAVVYKQPAIAVPISSIRATVTVNESPDFRLIARNLNDQHFDATAENPFVKLVNAIAASIERPLPQAAFTIHSDIPIASGLGSGAAIATALGRAVFAHFGVEVSPETLNPFVYETEKTYHGTPSGIDNTVIVYEKPIRFVRGEPIEVLSTFSPFHLLIANTGIEAPTKEAVGDVRQLYEANPSELSQTFEAIGEVVRRGYSAMQTGNLVEMGRAMNDNHRLLQQLTVSSEALDRLVDAALANGALGAKLSGGGRGGNMIALVTSETASQVKKALLNAGAISVIETDVHP
jgi:mevalonate kinase